MSNLIGVMIGCPVYNKSDKLSYCVDLLVDGSNSKIIAIPNVNGWKSELRPSHHMIVVSGFIPNGEYWDLGNPVIKNECRKIINGAINRHNSAI